MNKFIGTFVFSLAIIIAPTSFAGITVGETVITEVVYHGGGCRKDSPPGMCCHAGSKPYHCH